MKRVGSSITIAKKLTKRRHWDLENLWRGDKSRLQRVPIGIAKVGTCSGAIDFDLRTEKRHMDTAPDTPYVLACSEMGVGWTIDSFLETQVISFLLLPARLHRNQRNDSARSYATDG